MNGSPLKARDIEALTFIYRAPESASSAAPNRWAKFLRCARVKRWKWNRHSSPSVRQGI
jgi:hypothetical protein